MSHLFHDHIPTALGAQLTSVRAPILSLQSTIKSFMAKFKSHFAQVSCSPFSLNSGLDSSFSHSPRSKTKHPRQASINHPLPSYIRPQGLLGGAIDTMPYSQACALWATTSAIAHNQPHTGTDGGLPLRRIFFAVASALPSADAHITRLDVLTFTVKLLQALNQDAPPVNTPPADTTASLRPLHAKTAEAEAAVQRYRRAHELLTAHVQDSQADTQTASGADVAADLLTARDAALLQFQELLRDLSQLWGTLAEAAFREPASRRLAELDTAAANVAAVLEAPIFQIPPDADDAAATDADRSQCTAALQQLQAAFRQAEEAVSRLSAHCQDVLDATAKRDAAGMLTHFKAMQAQMRTLISLESRDGRSFHDMIVGLPWPAVFRCFHRQRTPLASLSDQLEILAARHAALVTLNAGVAAAQAQKSNVIAHFEKEYKTLKKARRMYLESRAQEDSSDDDGDSAAVSVQLAQRRDACRSAAHSRDAAARTLFALARAYFPEILLQQRKRLGRNAALAAWSERQLQYYNDRAPLARAKGGRHLIIKATYDGKPCVLKDMPFDAAQRMCKEVDVLRRLDHPNIVHLEAVFSENDHLYMHLPFAKHGDLEQFLASQVCLAHNARVPPTALFKLSRQLCEALAYLAERSVVHCDVKPANIFVDGDQAGNSLRAVLGDFDVSHTASGRTSTLTLALQTRAVATHYSAGYAAPEVVCASAGVPPRATHKLDVYGLGCVIFHMHMYPRALREPASLQDNVAAADDIFDSDSSDTAALAPCSAAWARTVPRDVVRAATKANASARLSARELLQTDSMRRANGEYARLAVQRPAYWEYQDHAGSWQVRESEDVRAAVEELMNSTAQPETHGSGRDSHYSRFQRFKVLAVHRVENSCVWSAFASQRRAVGEALSAEGYVLPKAAQELATSGFVYPLDDGGFDPAAGEMALFHGTAFADSIASAGFDVRYAFARRGAGAAFGRGVYFAESPSKADQYVRAGLDGKLRMFLSRVCLGRCKVVSAMRGAAPFLPEVEGVSTVEVPVYYDSILADAPGMRFREIVVGRDASAYPELLVEYERMA